MELSKIVKAEEQAEKIIRDAEKKRQDAIDRALQEREASLANVQPPAKAAITPKTALPDLKHIEEVAKQHREAAVKAILEGFHAAS